MDVLEPSFMLLPNFSFKPEKQIQLGSIIPMSKSIRRPDPTRSLSARVTVPADDISRQDSEPWTWDSEKLNSVGGKVFADVSLLTGIGAGLEGGREQTTGLTIECERIVRSTFNPSPTAIAAALRDETLSQLLEKITRPAVYIVTGIMVAQTASINLKKSNSTTGGAHASVDVTSTGVPLKAGLGGNVGQGTHSALTHNLKEPFVLAYQLLRVRRKLFQSSIDAAPENKWALFDDSGVEPTNSDGLPADMQIDEVNEGTVWDD